MSDEEVRRLHFENVALEKRVHQLEELLTSYNFALEAACSIVKSVESQYRPQYIPNTYWDLEFKVSPDLQPRAEILGLPPNIRDYYRALAFRSRNANNRWAERRENAAQQTKDLDKAPTGEKMPTRSAPEEAGTSSRRTTTPHEETKAPAPRKSTPSVDRTSRSRPRERSPSQHRRRSRTRSPSRLRTRSRSPAWSGTQSPTRTKTPQRTKSPFREAGVAGTRPASPSFKTTASFLPATTYQQAHVIKLGTSTISTGNINLASKKGTAAPKKGGSMTALFGSLPNVKSARKIPKKRIAPVREVIDLTQEEDEQFRSRKTIPARLDNKVVPKEPISIPGSIPTPEESMFQPIEMLPIDSDTENMLLGTDDEQRETSKAVNSILNDEEFQSLIKVPASIFSPRDVESPVPVPTIDTYKRQRTPEEDQLPDLNETTTTDRPPDVQAAAATEKQERTSSREEDADLSSTSSVRSGSSKRTRPSRFSDLKDSDGATGAPTISLDELAEFRRWKTQKKS